MRKSLVKNSKWEVAAGNLTIVAICKAHGIKVIAASVPPDVEAITERFKFLPVLLQHITAAVAKAFKFSSESTHEGDGSCSDGSLHSHCGESQGSLLGLSESTLIKSIISIRRTSEMQYLAVADYLWMKLILGLNLSDHLVRMV